MVYIDEENKKVSKLYHEYKQIKQQIQDWSRMLWSKLDADQLKNGSDKWTKLLKKFGNSPEF